MAKQDNAAAKAAAKQKRQERWARVKQVFEAFKMQRREDPKLLPFMLGAFVGIAVLVFLLGIPFGMQFIVLPAGIALGVLAAVMIFGRRVQSNVYRKAEGQPGAAAWALDNLRGQWRLTQAVAGTAQLDAVHRLIGRPGVVLVGEGVDHRVKSLIAQEKKRVSRLVGDTPIYEITVGDGEDQIPLRKLQSRLMKLPRNINQGQIDSLEKRLSALASRGNAMPKGPVPQGAKMRTIQRASRKGK